MWLIFDLSILNRNWFSRAGFFMTLLASSVLLSCDSSRSDGNQVTRNLKVAFIGDQGLGVDSVAVLELIASENTSMVLHQGDFDYQNNPELWIQQIDSVLGRDFPYFASVGNHDVLAWDGYQAQLRNRLDRIDGAECSGELGVNSACTYKGLFFVLSGVGTLGSEHNNYLSNELNNSQAIWKICSWHKNQHLMQVGGKEDEVGWDAYEICRRAGAIIATGHEHSYSRTYLMDNFESQQVAYFSEYLTLTEGQSFAFVSGIAGFGIRPELDGLGSNEWWASVYTSLNDAKPGALFCTFNPDGNQRRADCYFKNILGEIIDVFYLISEI